MAAVVHPYFHQRHLLKITTSNRGGGIDNVQMPGETRKRNSHSSKKGKMGSKGKPLCDQVTMRTDACGNNSTVKKSRRNSIGVLASKHQVRRRWRRRSTSESHGGGIGGRLKKAMHGLAQAPHAAVRHQNGVLVDGAMPVISGC